MVTIPRNERPPAAIRNPKTAEEWALAVAHMLLWRTNVVFGEGFLPTPSRGLEEEALGLIRVMTTPSNISEQSPEVVSTNLETVGGVKAIVSAAQNKCEEIVAELCELEKRLKAAKENQ